MPKKREESPACPKCGRRDFVRPIVYGMPGSDLGKAAKRGEIVLGGCEVGGEDPGHHCLSCGVSFDFARPELAGGKAGEQGWIEDRELLRWLENDIPILKGEERKQVNDGQ